MRKLASFLSFSLFTSAALILLHSCTGRHHVGESMVYSPDSSLQLICRINDSLSGQVQYSLQFHQKEIIQPSGFELRFRNMDDFKSNLNIVGVTKENVNETWTRVWGKRKNVINQYSQLMVELQESVKPHRKVNLHFRLYNDAVAMRYEIPRQKDIDSLLLSDEKIAFRFADNHTTWATFWNTFRTSQEKEFDKVTLKDVKQDNILGTPVLVNTGSAWVALMEAGITDWCASGFSKEQGYDFSLVSKPSYRQDDSTLMVRTLNQRLSPWKVIMVADEPGRFIESDILQNLNEPCALDDVSWIKPGVSSWDWWWCGSYAPDAGFPLGSNTQTMKYFIDFASEMGWQYQLVDWHWYGAPFDDKWQWDPARDITKMNTDIDIPALVQYAAERNVRLLLWLEWHHVNRQMEEAFALYEKWGIAGVKIDFMDRNDQEMVNFYHRVAETAARHHLLVDFHGAFMPDGFSRTYPNLITREGVLGNEYNKWSNRITPLHCLTLPFTRMLGGEMDFTPGGFLNTMPDQFVVVGDSNPKPQVMGTRCFQLAMVVVYESALTVFCESPYNARNKPGSDFLKGIPTTWDETHVIEGMVGESIVVARKSGKDWYIGGMSLNATEFELPLDFLDDGQCQATLWMDATDSHKNPQQLVKDQKEVSKTDTIHVNVSENGGFTAILKRK